MKVQGYKSFNTDLLCPSHKIRKFEFKLKSHSPKTICVMSNTNNTRPSDDAGTSEEINTSRNNGN